VALSRAGLVAGADVFTEGGFRKNTDYNALLAAALPSNSVYLTDIAEATAFGAAMTALVALEGKGGSEADFAALASRFEIDYRPVGSMAEIPGLNEYRRAWLGLVDGGQQ
jgi:sugar (pentulose or hexulose) kinase